MTTLSTTQLYPYLFLLGNCLIWYGTTEPHFEAFILILPSLLLLRYQKTRLLAVLLLGSCFAEFSVFKQQQWHFSEEYATDNHLLTGKIQGLPFHRGEIVRIRFKLLSINHQKPNTEAGIYLRLSCYRKCPDFKAEQQWQLLVRLKPPNGYVNAQGFDYEKWLYAQQFKATGYILSSTQNKLLSTDFGINTVREKVRSYFENNINEQTNKGSIIALTLGDKSHLYRQQQQMLAENGLSHLMAISGLHIGLSAIPGFLFAGFIWRKVTLFQSLNRIHFQWLLCMVPAIFYTALSGFGLPAWRALIMLVVFATTQLWRQSLSTYNRLGLALWFIILTQPLAPLQVSFWLSFCATAILIFISTLFQAKNPLYSLIRLQGQLFIILLPIQLLLFGSVSLLSPVLNIVAIPFVSVLLLPLLLFVVLLILFSVPGIEYILWITEQLLSLFWYVLTTLAPYSEYVQYSSTELNIRHFLTYPLLLIILLSVRLRVKLVIIFMLILLQQHRQSSYFKMMVLDVGQGLAISINYQDKLLIYDTAYGSVDFTVAEMTLFPWLDYLPNKSIDLLVVGHADVDHSGGTKTLLNTIPVKEMIIGPDVILPTNNQNQPLTVQYCQQGQSWYWNEMSINVLSPEADNELLEEGNDSSCVLLLKINEYSILITGDIEFSAEKQLLMNYPEIRADILMIPHHGSKTSSSEQFIKQVNPVIGIISSGFLNRFNLPAENIVKRYQKNAVQVLDTAYSGAIELTINSEGSLKIIQWRHNKSALWRRH